MAYGNPTPPRVDGTGALPKFKYKGKVEKSDWEIEHMKRAYTTNTNMDPKKELYSVGDVLWSFVAAGGVFIVYELLKYYG